MIMLNQDKLKITKIGTLFIPVIFSLILFLLNACQPNISDRTTPKVVKGVLDLRAWDFERQGSIHLDGQWEFYWRRLLSPNDFARGKIPPRSDWFNIPGRWDGYSLKGKRLKGDGFATFRLRVLLGADDGSKAIRILNQSSAYILWINGRIVAQNGVVGDSRKTMQPQYLLQEAILPAHSGKLDVVLQVSNFNHRKGGVWNPILLGTGAQIKKRHTVQWVFDLFLFGSLIVMGVYHFCLYLLRRKDPSPLFFGFFCLVIGLRILVTGDRYLTVIFPDFSWEWLYRAEMLSVTVSLAMLVLFIESLFRRHMPPIIPRLFIGAQFLISLIIILMPAGISGYTVMPNQGLILLVFVLIIGVLIRAIRQKEINAAIILSGFACFFITLVNDILTTNDAIYTMDLAPFGVFFMILSQSFVLSLRFSRAFAAVETLSLELEKKNRDLFRMDRLKDEFLARTSHELRTPLNGIIGIAESLLSGISGRISRITASNLSMIVSSARRLTNLVNDILDFSRLKNRDIVLHTRPIDMHALIDTVLTVSRPLVQGKHIELINAVPQNSPPVAGDEDRLQQIMFNLIGNAVKFTDQGEVRVCAVAGDSFLEISVSDTGIGVPRNKLKDIFQSFEQADSSETRAFGGTGLGLSITRQLVELHGGHITAESEKDKGATFRFTLPISHEEAGIDSLPKDSAVMNTPLLPPLADAGPDLSEEVLPDRETRSGAAARVLAVDDDPVNLRVVANHLSFLNISVGTSTNGREALEKIETGEKPDLILLDIMMPRMTGYEVCRRLRTSFSSSELPIIMLTAKNLVTDLVYGFESGANDYLLKPFTKDELIARVRIHLKLKQAFYVLRENLSLKNELQERKQTIRDLRILQRRFSEILNRVEDALIAVNESNEISFCNESCERLLGYKSQDLLGQPLSFILPAEAGQLITTLKDDPASAQRRPGALTGHHKVRFQGADEDDILADVRLTTLVFEEEHFTLLILRKPSETRQGKTHEQFSALKLIEELNRNRVRIQTLEGSLNRLFSKDPGKYPRLLNELRVIDTALEGLGRSITGDEDFGNRRRLALEVMNLALEYWSEATGSTKFEMARRSKLWKVYTNQDGWERAQTLDKYLDPGAFPKRPRWDRIIKTADFVLASCEKTTHTRDRLEQSLEGFRTLL
jgi:two-component system sensor histidine kinase ChiS